MVRDLPGGGQFRRGLHPPERKELAESAAIEVLPSPKAVLIPLVQHIGAPCRSLVKIKDAVQAGQKIGDVEAFISAPVHTPLAGVVQKETAVTLPTGRRVPAVPILADETQPGPEAIWNDVLGGDWPADGLNELDPLAIVKAVRNAGIVGCGGAAFPTHVKITHNAQKPVDTVLVNGCECEPYLTADYRLMLQAPAAVVAGAILGARACGAKQIIVAIEDNKTDAAEQLAAAAEGTPVRVAVVKTKYPMGGERQTIPAVLKREVPTGALPLDVGVVVLNVGTCAAIARAVLRDKPLTHRVVSVTGGGIARPRNILAPVGVTYAELIDFCGGLKAEAARIISGGPMMGFALGDLAVPITKGTSGIVCLTHDDVRKADETQCVRCGRCVDVCPLHLVPTRIALAARAGNWELAKRYHITACCDCGCCSYTCPASIPLTQLIRMGKQRMPKG